MNLQDFHLLKQCRGHGGFDWHLDLHGLSAPFDVAVICVLSVRRIVGNGDGVMVTQPLSRGGVMVCKVPLTKGGDKVGASTLCFHDQCGAS